MTRQCAYAAERGLFAFLSWEHVPLPNNKGAGLACTAIDGTLVLRPAGW